MLRGKSNKSNRLCSNLLAILLKSGMAMAIPSIPIAMALNRAMDGTNLHSYLQLVRENLS